VSDFDIHAMMSANRLTFAIGDIHGCRRALADILARCRGYARGIAHRFVFIGDYIDRGPDSRGVIETIRMLERSKHGDVVCLLGNHEELLLAAVAGNDLLQWLDNGGGATLASYGVSDLRDLPPEDIAWLKSLRLTFDDGKRFFVHAGIDPDRPLDKQERETLLWIRGRFHRARKDYGRLIVHGHTPTSNAEPQVRSNRINIDTGCVYGGVLTAAVFTDEEAAPVAFLTGSD